MKMGEGEGEDGDWACAVQMDYSQPSNSLWTFLI